MKNRFALPLLIALFLISCSTDQAVKPLLTEEEGSVVYGENEWPQKWKLIEFSGNMWNVPPTTGQDMPYQEWYVLHENGTFIKRREQEDLITEAEGAFVIKTYNHGKFIDFTFESENRLIGNCGPGLTESLHLAPENKLVGSWLMCDGPGLVYERVKYDRAEERSVE